MMTTGGTPQAMASPFHVMLTLLLLAAPLGCAHTPPPPLAEATKAHLGTIGVVSAQYPPQTDYRTPGRGGAGGAAIGVAKGLGLGVFGAAACLATIGHAPEACVLAVATPYFAVRYAVDQATEGVPPETIEAAETAIKAVLAERGHQAAARDALFRVTAEQTGQTLVLLPDQGPPTPSAPPRYRRLADQGIDTVLELTVQQIALRGPSAASGSLWSISATDLNPHLDLVVTTQRRVLKTADGTALYDHTGAHSAGGATFTEWGANDAQLLRERLDQLLREIAGEIVSQVFGVPVPSIAPEGPTAPESDQEQGRTAEPSLSPPEAPGNA